MNALAGIEGYSMQALTAPLTNTPVLFRGPSPFGPGTTAYGNWNVNTANSSVNNYLNYANMDQGGNGKFSISVAPPSSPNAIIPTRRDYQDSNCSVTVTRGAEVATCATSSPLKTIDANGPSCQLDWDGDIWYRVDAATNQSTQIRLPALTTRYKNYWPTSIAGMNATRKDDPDPTKRQASWLRDGYKCTAYPLNAQGVRQAGVALNADMRFSLSGLDGGQVTQSSFFGTSGKRAWFNTRPDPTTNPTTDTPAMGWFAANQDFDIECTHDMPSSVGVVSQAPADSSGNRPGANYDVLSSASSGMQCKAWGKYRYGPSCAISWQNQSGNSQPPLYPVLNTGIAGDGTVYIYTGQPTPPAQGVEVAWDPTLTNYKFNLEYIGDRLEASQVGRVHVSGNPALSAMNNGNWATIVGKAGFESTLQSTWRSGTADPELKFRAGRIMPDTTWKYASCSIQSSRYNTGGSYCSIGSFLRQEGCDDVYSQVCTDLNTGVVTTGELNSYNCQRCGGCPPTTGGGGLNGNTGGGFTGGGGTGPGNMCPATSPRAGQPTPPACN